jgi:hypothetical protein
LAVLGVHGDQKVADGLDHRVGVLHVDVVAAVVETRRVLVWDRVARSRCVSNHLSPQARLLSTASGRSPNWG